MALLNIVKHLPGVYRKPTAYSLLPTAYSLQPTAYSLQPTAYSLQPNGA